MIDVDIITIIMVLYRDPGQDHELEIEYGYLEATAATTRVAFMPVLLVMPVPPVILLLPVHGIFAMVTTVM